MAKALDKLQDIIENNPFDFKGLSERELQVKKLQMLSSVVLESLTRKEFIQFAQALIKQILEIEKKVIDRTSERNNKLTKESQDQLKVILDKLQTETEKNLAGLKNTTEKELATISSALSNMQEEVARRLAEVKDGVDADEEKVISNVLSKITIPQIEDLEKDIPKLGEPIRDALELLKEDERIDKKAIRGLEDMEKDIAEIKKRPAGQSGMRKIPIIRVVDLTASVDGAATTFTVPRDTIKVHMCWTTQSPIILRPDVDFTLAGNTLTIVNTEVGTLASGQTLTAMVEVLFYAK